VNTTADYNIFERPFVAWFKTELLRLGYKSGFTIKFVNDARYYTISFDDPRDQFLYNLKHMGNGTLQYWQHWVSEITVNKIQNANMDSYV
jgi:hypothetical protein